MQKKSFTLVELMIVIAILAILSAIVIFALNPARLFDNFRDSKRVTDISSINKAIVFMESWNQSGITYGTTTNVYISLPDSNSNCSSYTLPTLPAGYSYYCSSPASYRLTDGSGWIPINFTVDGPNKYLSALPVDPVNNTAYFYTYYTGGSYELTAILANPNKNSINDEGSLTSTFEIGSPNRAWTTPLQRDKNLIAFWKFDEATVTAQDYSGNGYAGTISGPVRQTIVGTNKAMYYDSGGADYISTPSFAIPNTGILTVEVWMKSQSHGSSYQHILSDSGESPTVGFLGYYRDLSSDYLSLIYSNGTNYAYHADASFFTGYNNTWVHAVMIYDANDKKGYFYRNGVLTKLSSLTGTPQFPSANRVKYIGAYNSGANRITDGSLDEVRIYNRGLSAEEVAQHYNSTKAKFGL